MSELYFPSLTSDNASDDAPANTSELQGALCGLLCLDSQANRMTWFQTIFADFVPSEEEHLDLTALFDDTVQALNSLDFDLRLDLPSDDMSLSSRILALTDWCQGLLFGLAASGLTDNTTLSPECQEYIADVIDIGQLSNDIEDSDTDESNYEELVEYLRMGLFLLYGELQPLDNTDDIAEH